MRLLLRKPLLASPNPDHAGFIFQTWREGVAEMRLSSLQLHFISMQLSMGWRPGSRLLSGPLTLSSARSSGANAAAPYAHA
jgi:hypothetical protein